MEEREDAPERISSPSNQDSVSAGDFTGILKAGGVAAGVESGVAQDVAEPEPDGTYELSAVDERPEVLNRSEFARRLSRNYPPLLRDAGISATITARFRILEGGRVDAASISIENSSHEGFNEPTRRSVEYLRFRPGHVAGTPVRVWMTMPVAWQVERPMS